jgi:hypothetical protein
MSKPNLRNPFRAANSAAEAASRTLGLRPGRRDEPEGQPAHRDYPRKTRQTTDHAGAHTQLIRQSTAVSLPYQAPMPAEKRSYESRTGPVPGSRRYGPHRGGCIAPLRKSGGLHGPCRFLFLAAGAPESHPHQLGPRARQSRWLPGLRRSRGWALLGLTVYVHARELTGARLARMA